MKALFRLRRSILFILKIMTYGLIGMVFFLVYRQLLPQFSQLSRTLAISLVAFCGSIFLMSRIYGSYNINERKSKSVVFSLMLVTFISNLVTFTVMMIMGINAVDQYSIKVVEVLWLPLIFMIQIVVIIIMVYLGNKLYFTIVPPAKVCLVVDLSQDNRQYLKEISRYKSQYDIRDVIDFADEEVYSVIDKNEHIFVLDIDIEHRTRIINYCYAKRKVISYTPSITDIAQLNCVDSSIGDIPIMTFNISEKTFEQRVVKRLMDISVSLVLILITSPLWIFTAIMIKRDDGGAIFFQQERVTINHKIFKIIKFRSMKENNGSFKQAVENDERITKVGQWLRRYRIDELPQLLNVLKGDMSLVGPRPEAKESYEVIQKKIPEFSYRVRVKAGITGMAQIYGRYNTPPLNKLKFDISYIGQFSIMLDIKLLFLTVLPILKKESVETNKE